MKRVFLFGLLLAAAFSLRAAPAAGLWSRDNTVAWCIVPYDAKKRGPAERAAMLEQLQLRKLAYDWRAEHVPTFDEEVVAMTQRGIEIVAWWFPTKLDDNARKILDAIAWHKIHPQLWVTGSGTPTKSPEEQAARIAAEVKRLQPIVDEAAKLSCQVGLYNHLNWFGEPENQLAVLAALRAGGAKNVGLVYNFHHAHEHLGRFATMWPKMQAEVLAVNLNGMAEGADKKGKKIMNLGEGDRELELMRVIQASGWRGLVGIVNHRTDVDAEVGLKRNLAGLDRLAAELKVK